MTRVRAGTTCRRIPLLLACALAVGGVCASSALAGDSPPSIQAAKTMRFRVLNATRDRLTVQDRTLAKGHWRGGGPVDAASLHVADFTMESESLQAKGDIRWRIGSSDYLLKVWGNVDGPSTNCTIQSLDRKDVSDSPYVCQERHTGGNDSDQYTVVMPKQGSSTTLVAGEQRRAVYETLCGAAGIGQVPYASCTPTLEDVSNGLGLAEPSGDMLANCSAGTAAFRTSFSRTTTETTTVGGSLGSEFNVVDWLQLKLEGTFERNMTKSKKWEDGAEIQLQGRAAEGLARYGWVASAPRVQVARMHVVASAGNQTFVLPDVTVRAPLDRTDAPDSSVLKSAYLNSDFCTKGDAADLRKLVPIPLDPDRVYSIGVRGANRRVIDVPAQSHAPTTQLELGQFDDRPGQRWQFVPVDGQPGVYQVRSDNDLDLCLDHAGGGIVQATCAADPTTSQRWTLDHSAAAPESFQLKSGTDGSVVGVAHGTLGEKLVTARADGTGVRTWWELGDA